MFECDKNPTAKYPTPEDLGMEITFDGNEGNEIAGLPFFEEGARFLQAYEDESRVNLDFDLEVMEGVPLADERGKLQPVPEIEVPSSPVLQDLDAAFSCASTASPKECVVQVRASTFPIPTEMDKKTPPRKESDPNIDEKTKRRLVANRMSAKRSREFKKQRTEHFESQVKILQEKITDLEDENKNVRMKLAEAEKEMIRLNTLLDNEAALRSEREIKKWVKTG